MRKPSSRALAMSESVTGRKDKIVRSESPAIATHIEAPVTSTALPSLNGPEVPSSELYGSVDDNRAEAVIGAGRVAVIDAPRGDAARETTSVMGSKALDGRDISARAGKKNLSLSRRQNEVIRLLELSKGVINTSRNSFVDDHIKLVESMAKAGEPTSCPVGTRVDRKTLNLTLESLEMAGRIKLLTASDASIRRSYTNGENSLPACGKRRGT